ncbi:hypothetical protein BDM02DRAFT_3117459 [Thelephora ganbajun]|uniref:Uncharacterized protein n=1 Tax=Thelephora ganbajun TaxID=370292 RepID=A0ACB6ZC75_THEGA|nr:hypothetical protein BDM02DRAFT_3117459 [Thelephora ganbajun]
MPFARSLFKSLFIISFSLSVLHISHALDVPLPQTAASAGNVVYGNFLGISFELSFLDKYFGTDEANTPQPFLNYLSNLEELLSAIPLRLRIGGNSMDSSIFNENQTQFSTFADPNANPNDQPVNYGPLVFKVMKAASNRLGGVEYLIGLSLRNPSDPMIPQLAAAAQSILGDVLDAYLLGNEPDLYAVHGQRPGLVNYTVDNYISDYNEAFKQLRQSSIGDIVALNKIAGPTICCAWDLATVLQQNWLETFKQQLKYISLQHYPYNNCGVGSPLPDLSYYINHNNVVELVQWNIHGVNLAIQVGKSVIMSEFSTISCGGYPTVSDTFGAALWSIDYAMRMATVGYSAAYLHTRERGVSYNPFNYPGDGVDGWTTQPTYYSYFPILQGLQSHNGSRVVDLGLSDSSAAGYGIYDKETSELYRMILVNFQDGNGPVDFVIPATGGSRAGGGKNATVKFLTATSIHEVSDISWSGQTWKGVLDGKPIASGRDADLTQADISASYTLKIPSPGLAVVRFEKPLPSGEPSGGGHANSSPTSSNSSGNTNPTGRTSKSSSGGNNGKSSVLLVGAPIIAALGTVFVGALF